MVSCFMAAAEYCSPAYYKRFEFIRRTVMQSSFRAKSF